MIRTKPTLLLAFSCLAVASAVARGGTIEGTIVNTSSGKPIPCQVEVILQLQVNGEFLPIRSITSDAQGHYCFSGVPEGKELLYFVGANRHGIFHPGPRIRLADPTPNAYAELSVCDAVAKPNPLALKKMDVTIRPEVGLLRGDGAALNRQSDEHLLRGRGGHGERPSDHAGAFNSAGV